MDSSAGSKADLSRSAQVSFVARRHKGDEGRRTGAAEGMAISAAVGEAEHQISSPHQAQRGTTENASRLIKQWAFALSFMGMSRGSVASAV